MHAGLDLIAHSKLSLGLNVSVWLLVSPCQPCNELLTCTLLLPCNPIQGLSGRGWVNQWLRAVCYPISIWYIIVKYGISLQPKVIMDCYSCLISFNQNYVFSLSLFALYNCDINHLLHWTKNKSWIAWTGVRSVIMPVEHVG